MTEMYFESTGYGRKEIGRQDRYFLPDPGFTPSDDRDAYRVNRVRVPMHLSRNENFQLFSTFLASQARHEMGSPGVAPAFAVRGQVFSPLPENGSGKRWKEVEREHKKSGNRWNGFHLLPPLSICFHEFPPQNLFEEKLYFKGGATVAAPGSRSLSQHIAAYRNVFFSQPSTFSHQPASFPTASSLFQRNPAYSNVFIFAERSGAVLDFAKRTHT